MTNRDLDTAAEDGYAAHFAARPVIVPITTVVILVVLSAILTGDVSFFWAGSAGASFLFFRRTWLVTRRRVAFAVGPSGVYLGTTLRKPRQRPELIPWEKISALEITHGDTDENEQTYVFVRGSRQTTPGEDSSVTEPGPRIAYRRVDGWHLDRWTLERAVRRHGPRTAATG